jgi:hypothetical protein
MGNVKKFKGANNTIMVKDAHGKIVNNIAGAKLPSGNVVIVPSEKLDPPVDWDLLERREVASNPDTRPEDLAELRNDSDKYVRALLARNLNTPVDMLGDLAFSTFEHERALVARNTSTAPQVLMMLAASGDESPWVRKGASDNPSLKLNQY